MMVNASHHLQVLRDRVKECSHGGMRLTSEDTISFLRSLNTVLELIRETEEENRMLRAAIHARAAGKPCLRLVQPGGGGDAA
ncbi:MAG: hypothetical protein H5U11_13905 [Rhizobium sp.]|nr:hypothetical protein [Rhizobium sp.]